MEVIPNTAPPDDDDDDARMALMSAPVMMTLHEGSDNTLALLVCLRISDQQSGKRKTVKVKFLKKLPKPAGFMSSIWNKMSTEYKLAILKSSLPVMDEIRAAVHNTLITESNKQSSPSTMLNLSGASPSGGLSPSGVDLGEYKSRLEALYPAMPAWIVICSCATGAARDSLVLPETSEVSRQALGLVQPYRNRPLEYREICDLLAGWKQLYLQDTAGFLALELCLDLSLVMPEELKEPRGCDPANGVISTGGITVCYSHPAPTMASSVVGDVITTLSAQALTPAAAAINTAVSNATLLLGGETPGVPMALPNSPVTIKEYHRVQANPNEPAAEEGVVMVVTNEQGSAPAIHALPNTVNAAAGFGRAKAAAMLAEMRLRNAQVRDVEHEGDDKMGVMYAGLYSENVRGGRYFPALGTGGAAAALVAPPESSGINIDSVAQESRKNNADVEAKKAAIRACFERGEMTMAEYESELADVIMNNVAATPAHLQDIGESGGALAAMDDTYAPFRPIPGSIGLQFPRVFDSQPLSKPDPHAQLHRRLHMLHLNPVVAASQGTNSVNVSKVLTPDSAVQESVAIALDGGQPEALVFLATLANPLTHPKHVAVLVKQMGASAISAYLSRPHPESLGELNPELCGLGREIGKSVFFHFKKNDIEWPKENEELRHTCKVVANRVESLPPEDAARFIQQIFMIMSAEPSSPNEPSPNEPSPNEPSPNEPSRNEPSRNEPFRNEPFRNETSENMVAPDIKPDLFYAKLVKNALAKRWTVVQKVVLGWILNLSTLPFDKDHKEASSASASASASAYPSTSANDGGDKFNNTTMTEEACLNLRKMTEGKPVWPIVGLCAKCATPLKRYSCATSASVPPKFVCLDCWLNWPDNDQENPIISFQLYCINDAVSAAAGQQQQPTNCTAALTDGTETLGAETMFSTEEGVLAASGESPANLFSNKILKVVQPTTIYEDSAECPASHFLAHQQNLLDGHVLGTREGVTPDGRRVVVSSSVTETWHVHTTQNNDDGVPPQTVISQGYQQAGTGAPAELHCISSAGVAAPSSKGADATWLIPGANGALRPQGSRAYVTSASSIAGAGFGSPSFHQTPIANSIRSPGVYMGGSIALNSSALGLVSNMKIINTNDILGSDAPGSDAPGSEAHGSDAHGSDAHGSDAHGSDAHGSDAGVVIGGTHNVMTEAPLSSALEQSQPPRLCPPLVEQPLLDEPLLQEPSLDIPPATVDYDEPLTMDIEPPAPPAQPQPQQAQQQQPKQQINRANNSSIRNSERQLPIGGHDLMRTWASPTTGSTAAISRAESGRADHGRLQQTTTTGVYSSTNSPANISSRPPPGVSRMSSKTMMSTTQVATASRSNVVTGAARASLSGSTSSLTGSRRPPPKTASAGAGLVNNSRPGGSGGLGRTTSSSTTNSPLRGPSSGVLSSSSQTSISHSISHSVSQGAAQGSTYGATYGATHGVTMHGALTQGAMTHGSALPPGTPPPPRKLSRGPSSASGPSSTAAAAAASTANSGPVRTPSRGGWDNLCSPTKSQLMREQQVKEKQQQQQPSSTKRK